MRLTYFESLADYTVMDTPCVSWVHSTDTRKNWSILRNYSGDYPPLPDCFTVLMLTRPDGLM